MCTICSSQDVRLLVFFALCHSKALEYAKEPNGAGDLSVAHRGANITWGQISFSHQLCSEPS